MKGLEATILPVDFIGHVQEEHLEAIADTTVFYDHSTGTLLIQTCDKVLAVTVADH